MKQAIKVKLAETEALAKKMAKALKGGEILALIGPLGAGKTTFVKTLGNALKIKHKITSPTFTLMHVFPLRLKTKPAVLYHLDLYRLKNYRETKALGIMETWGRPNTLTVIEWADKIKKHLPGKTIYIYFSHNS
jgi:tRNA threonylcarbamoyladenosine biosynthesis protein TsaE